MKSKVIVASHRASNGVYADRSGPILVEGLRALDFEIEAAEVVDDGRPLSAALRLATGSDYQLIK